MPGDEFRLGESCLRKLALECARYPDVQGLASGAQQAGDGHILKQGVPKRVDRIWWGAFTPNEPDREQMLKGNRDLLFPRHQRSEHFEGEPGTNKRPNLRNLLPPTETIQAGHQCILKGFRHVNILQRAFALAPETARLQHRLRQLLQEERHTICMGNDPVQHAAGYLTGARNSFSELDAVVLRQPLKDECLYMRTLFPRRCEIWPERHQQENRQIAYALHQAVE